MCKPAVVFTILCCICFIQAQNVALSGVVKLGDETPVEGVRVTLAGLGTLSVVTKEDGTFSLNTSGSSVAPVPETPLNRYFTLKENAVLFTQAARTANLEVSVHTIDGGTVSSHVVSAGSPGANRVTLPLSGSGIYYLAVTTGKRKIVHPLICVGKKLHCETGSVTPAGDRTVSAVRKKAAGIVVDTLFAEKNGYRTAEYPLTGYEEDSIELILRPETGFADVIAVAVTGNENNYTFNATLSTSDIDCTHFADWFEVLTDSGELVYRRILAHPHTEAFSGNPFTRGGGSVTVTSGQVVIVRAHLNDAGYAGMAMRGTVDSGFEDAPDITAVFAPGVASEPPQPEECIPEATIFGQ